MACIIERQERTCHVSFADLEIHRKSKIIEERQNVRGIEILCYALGAM